ncbi:MAG: ISAs1 family transposase, partial [Kiritimatiellaeota bacterium]|nr:ISAs1 family transposase [Kiritimatiellota bacterium]
VHFGEDFCRVEDKNVQQNLNIARKIALNCVKTHKRKSGLASPLSKLMFDCLLDCEKLIPVLRNTEN